MQVNEVLFADKFYVGYVNDMLPRNKKMGALDVRCLYEIHTIRYLNYLLNISHDFIYIIGSRSIWILGSSIVTKNVAYYVFY
jgi:hypothetical protein